MKQYILQIHLLKKQITETVVVSWTMLPRGTKDDIEFDWVNTSHKDTETLLILPAGVQLTEWYCVQLCLWENASIQYSLFFSILNLDQPSSMSSGWWLLFGVSSMSIFYQLSYQKYRHYFFHKACTWYHQLFSSWAIDELDRDSVVADPERRVREHGCTKQSFIYSLSKTFDLCLLWYECWQVCKVQAVSRSIVY